MRTFSKNSFTQNVKSNKKLWSTEDHNFIRQAFQLAYKVQGKTLPNPAVGAVLVNKGKIIGKGATEAAGQNHAEIVAMLQATKKSQQIHGSILYVTLEPCCHHGKTPPCTDAIISAGIKEVIIAIKDPNPKVAGKGIKALRKAGIKVRQGIEAEAAAEFYRGFFFYIQNGRPLISLKIAQSLDGRINDFPGKRAAITGKEFQIWTHQLRTKVDAIITTGQTVRIDDPDLTPRFVRGNHPEVLVLSRKGPLPQHAKVFVKLRKSATLVMFESQKKPVPYLPTWIVQYQFDKKALSGKKLVKTILQLFKTRGYHSVLIEGGPTLWSVFLNSGIWDSLYIATAPILMPDGEKWERHLTQDWGKSLKFRNFATFGKDFLAEFGNSGFRG